MKIWWLFYTLRQGQQENKRRKKKFSLLKCIQKSNVIKKKIWVLVFSFMYLVLVDAMDWSIKTNFTPYFRKSFKMSAFKFLTIPGIEPISEDMKTFIENAIMSTKELLSPMTDLGMDFFINGRNCYIWPARMRRTF